MVARYALCANGDNRCAWMVCPSQSQSPGCILSATVNSRNILSCLLVPSRAVPSLGGASAVGRLRAFLRRASTVSAYIDLVKAPYLECIVGWCCRSLLLFWLTGLICPLTHRNSLNNLKQEPLEWSVPRSFNIKTFSFDVTRITFLLFNYHKV